jgi:MFS family permease
MGSGRAPLLTRRFLLVVLSGLAYFLALAMLLPVVPRYVEGPLGGGSVAVGVAVGSFAVGAVLLRPFAGRIGDRTGRRVLIVGGALVVAASTACYGLVGALPWIVGTRFVAGVGEAAFFVGAATMITDLAPVERRGEAVSYWSVAVYGGLAFGPVLGEVVVGDTSGGGGRWGAAWALSAALAATAAALGAATVEVPRDAPTGPPPRLVHPAAVGPGTVLFLGLIGLAGFSAFVPLYVDELDLSDAGPIFLLYGVLVLVVRVIGARLPDRVGPLRSATAALALGGAGTAVMATWVAVPGLVAGTMVFAAGMSLMYPALLLLSLTGVPDGERAAVVGTFSSFFDLSQGLGALLCGVVVALTSDRGAFAAGAVCAGIGLVVLRRSSSLRGRAAAPVA